MWTLASFATIVLLPLTGCIADIPAASSVQHETSTNNITYVKATIGRQATIKCLALNLVGQKTVSWVRYRDISLIAVGKFVYIADDRFKVLHEPHSKDWFLVIKSVGYKDEGIYECQVNSEPYKTFKFHLSVVEPRTEILGDHELYVDYASSLNLTCQVVSPDPPAYVFWKKEGKLVDVPELSRASDPSLHKTNVRVVFDQHWRPGVTVSSLLIARVNSSHSGQFQCMPSNSEAKAIRVHVLKDDSKPAAIQTTNQNSSQVASTTTTTNQLIFLTLAAASTIIFHNHFRTAT